MSPRLAVIGNLYPPHLLGGYEILCKQVVDALVSRGWEIRVLTSTHGVAGMTEEVVDDVPVSRRLGLYIPFGEPPHIDRAHRAKVTADNALIAQDWFGEWKPDIAFFWSQLRSTVGPIRAAMRCGIRRAITFNDANFASYAPAPWKRPHKALADRLVYSDSTTLGLDWGAATCISKVVRDDLANQLGHPVEAKVIHQGVPVDELPAKDLPGSAHDPFRVLYAGQLHRYKGVHDLIAAIASLIGKRRISLSIAGHGDTEYENELRKMAQGSDVTFLGRLGRTDLVQQYQLADALVFPSIWREPFGLTHLEAMACGVPVISTANGGQGEFLKDSLNSLIVEPERPDQVASAIERLIDDSALRIRLADEGIRLTRAEYSLTRYVDDLETWLRGML